MAGGDIVKGVTFVDSISEIGIGEAEAVVNGVAGTCQWNKERLVGVERGGRRGDVAGDRDHPAAHREEVGYRG